MRAIVTAAAVSVALACSGPAFAQSDTGWDEILVSYDAESAAALRGTVAYQIPETYELAVIALSLTPAGPDLIADTDYAHEVRAHFAPFAAHPLIAALSAEARSGDWFKAYDFRENAYVYCFGADDRLVRCGRASHVWGRQANSFARNLPLIEDFARVSGFREFFRAHAAVYRDEQDAWRERAPVEDMWRWLEQRFPDRIQHYAIVFSPLVSGWHSTQGFSDNGFRSAAMFLQSARGYAAHQAARVVFTEIDHNYVNRATERFAQRRPLSAFDPGFWSAGSSAAYATPETVFNEYMTWGVFLLWAREHYPPDTFAQANEAAIATMQDRRGFTHFAVFQAELERRYLAQRRKNIEALYPALFRWAELYRSEAQAASPEASRP